jgi:hypothetical protein
MSIPVRLSANCSQAMNNKPPASFESREVSDHDDVVQSPVAQGAPFRLMARPPSTTLPLTESLMVARSTAPRSRLIAPNRTQGRVEWGHFGAGCWLLNCSPKTTKKMH